MDLYSRRSSATLGSYSAAKRRSWWSDLWAKFRRSVLWIWGHVVSSERFRWMISRRRSWRTSIGLICGGSQFCDLQTLLIAMIFVLLDWQLRDLQTTKARRWSLCKPIDTRWQYYAEFWLMRSPPWYLKTTRRVRWSHMSPVAFPVWSVGLVLSHLHHVTSCPRSMMILFLHPWKKCIFFVIWTSGGLTTFQDW